jgi:hypothetical protein
MNTERTPLTPCAAPQNTDSYSVPQIQNVFLTNNSLSTGGQWPPSRPAPPGRGARGPESRVNILDKTERGVDEASRRRKPGGASRMQNQGGSAAAAQNALLTTTAANTRTPFCRSTTIRIVIAILYPLPHVAVHVMQPPGACRKTALGYSSIFNIDALST